MSGRADRQGASRTSRRATKGAVAQRNRSADRLDRLITTLRTEELRVEDGRRAFDPEVCLQIVRGDDVPGHLYGPPVSRAIEGARTALEPVRASQREAARRVRQLLEASPEERWRRLAADVALHHAEVVDLLIETARPIDRAKTDGEEVLLLALHLVERLDPDAYPSGLVGDLHCRGLALRVLYLLHQRRQRAAELAALRSRELHLESTDPLVVFEGGLATSVLAWTADRGASALETLLDHGGLARVMGEMERATEMTLWAHLLIDQLGDPDLAADLKDRAARMSPSPDIEASLEAVRARYEWLHLDEARLACMEVPSGVN